MFPFAAFFCIVRATSGGCKQSGPIRRGKLLFEHFTGGNERKSGLLKHSLGFGFERIGLPAVQSPRIALVLIIAFSLFCALGILRLKTVNTLSELFVSDTVEFKNYEKLSSRFPTSEFDVLVVVEADNLLTPKRLEQLRALHLELQFAKAVDGLLSIFSMREATLATDVPAPVIPAELPKGEAFKALSKKILAHPLIGGKLLSNSDGQGQITLLVITLNNDVLKKDGLAPSIREIEKIAQDFIEPTGMRVRLAGAPVMQLEIRDAIRRDRLIYNGTGFFVGFLICLAFFRRLKLVAITSVCSGVSVLWALGILGWIGLELNTFINVIPPLVMVIAYTDAMHMVFSIRRRLRQGDDKYQAAKHAILTVGPACVLTSLTTAIAFSSLTLTDSGLIRTFGIAAGLATLLAFVTVIVVLPTLFVLMYKDVSDFIKTEETHNRALSRLEDICNAFGKWIDPRRIPIALVGILVGGVFLYLHFQLEPRYRLSDQVPDSKQSIAASERLDNKLTGAYPVHIMLEWPSTEHISSPRIMKAVSETHKLLQQQPGIGNVWSVETLNQWLREAGETGPGVLDKYLKKMPGHLVARFVNAKENSAVVTGRLPNLDAEEAVPVLTALDKSLSGVRANYPEIKFTVSGLSVLSALRSSDMIRQLSRGLMSAVVVVIIVIGLAFRSLQASLLSIMPNILPIVAAGSLLYLTGGGLGYASVIALTVAFGIAVDDTIHFLNRLLIERERADTLEDAVHGTITRLGPVLVLTTAVLVAGLAATSFSDLPSMRLFGKLFMTTLAAALVGDLLFMPALILVARKYLQSWPKP